MVVVMKEVWEEDICTADDTCAAGDSAKIDPVILLVDFSRPNM